MRSTPHLKLVRRPPPEVDLERLPEALRDMAMELHTHPRHGSKHILLSLREAHLIVLILDAVADELERLTAPF